MTDYGAEAMTHEERTQIINFFMYRLKPELRETLMATLPAAYNAYYGEKVVTVKTPDGREMLPETTKFVDGKFVKVRQNYQESELNK